MTTELLHHGVVAAVAFLTTTLATPLVRRVCVAVGAVAEPGERHIHVRPTATLGGVALFAGFLAAVGAASRLSTFDDLFRTSSEPEAIVLASVVIVVIGMIDDVHGVSAPAKLAGQILAAGLLALFGFRLLFVYLPPNNLILLGPNDGALITVMAVVAMINAVNLVDGLDGLAAGIVAIAGTALFVYTQVGEPDLLLGALTSSAPMILAAVVGACLGFLVHNFNPASIFMGDTGAMLLGLLIASAGVSAVGGAVRPSRSAFAAVSVPVLVPVLVLAVPFLDTALTILRRLISGRAVFSPDKQHLHHRLLEIGHSHRRAVLIMYYWSALLAFAAVGVSALPLRTVAASFGLGVGIALVTSVVGRFRTARARRGHGGGRRGELCAPFHERRLRRRKNHL